MKSLFKILLCACLASLLYSCARMGHPQGGERDVLPPLYIRSNPPMGATNVKSGRIEIEFDELIQLKDQMDKVIVSPAQTQQPIIRSNARRVTVEFRDSLIPNTTYTIDFADAIQDFTEGNPLESFALTFSTGDSIDTLSISGIVLDAHTLEPQQKTLVGVHTNLDDSAFTSLPFVRVAKTNDRGQFTVRNLKPGKYRIFAVNDVDRNNRFTIGEDIAFYPEIIEPYAVNSMRQDTIFTPTHEIDTVVERMHTTFYPNDILLAMFNENRNAQYMIKDERIDSARLYVEFAAHADSLPEIALIDFPNKKDWYRVNHSLTNDTITYWLTDSVLMKADTLRVQMQYLKTNSANILELTTDTVLFKLRKQRPQKKEKKKKDELEDSLKLPKHIPTKFSFIGGGSQEIDKPLRFEAKTPLDTILQSGISMFIKNDTVWDAVTPPVIVRDNPGSLHNYHADYEWTPGAQYRIAIDSASVRDIYGLVNDSIGQEFKVKALDEYSELTFKVDAPDSSFIELMQSDDKASYTAVVEDGMAIFSYVNPGKYYARLIIDTNRNGKFDTGLYSDSIQPEDVYYYPKRINLRRNWDVEESWEIAALPVDMQKPDDIKKNKPAKKKWEEKSNARRNEEDEYNEEDEIFDVNRNPFAPASSRKNAATHY